MRYLHYSRNLHQIYKSSYFILNSGHAHGKELSYCYYCCRNILSLAVLFRKYYLCGDSAGLRQGAIVQSCLYTSCRA